MPPTLDHHMIISLHQSSACRTSRNIQETEKCLPRAAERWASGAADSRSEERAEAIGGRLHAVVRPSRLSLPPLRPHCPWQC